MSTKIRVVCLSLALTVAVGCERGPTAEPESARNGASGGEAARPNLLLITLDTTRADRLGCYGWKNARTPVLDGLAERGARFTNAFSQAPITLPSHTTLLTGLYPPEHGLRVNGKNALAPGIPLLSEALQQRGYRTGAFLAAAVLDARYGLSRGFNVYLDELGTSPTGAPASQVAGDVVTRRALAWLQHTTASEHPSLPESSPESDESSDPARPFFCWVHYFDPHTPHTPPPALLEQLGDPYDAEIAFMDAQIGRLLTWLSRNGHLDNTLIVAVADHGESLGEHGYDWHSLLVYDGIMRVPLIVHLPNRVPAGTVVDAPVRLADIAPTICEMLGAPPLETASGASFASVFRGNPLTGRTCYGESDYPYDSFGWSPLRFWIADGWKYIRAPQPELYRLSDDRGELRNLAADEPQRLARMEADLAAFEATLEPRERADVTLDTEALRMLQSLGYVGGADAAPEEGAALKDPKDMTDVHGWYRMAEAYLAANDANRAVELLTLGEAQSPESIAIVQLLADSLVTAQRHEDAQRCIQRAVARYPESAGAIASLARILALRGRFAQAIEHFELALELEPNDDRAREQLAAARRYLGQQRTEITAARTAIQTLPTHAGLYANLDALLEQAGRVLERAKLLEDAVARFPDDASLALSYAELLATAADETLRDGRRAVTLAERALGMLDAPSARALAVLAAARAEVGEFQKAIGTAQQAFELARRPGAEASVTRIEAQISAYRAGEPYRALP